MLWRYNAGSSPRSMLKLYWVCLWLEVLLTILEFLFRLLPAPSAITDEYSQVCQLVCIKQPFCSIHELHALFQTVNEIEEYSAAFIPFSRYLSNRALWLSLCNDFWPFLKDLLVCIWLQVVFWANVACDQMDYAVGVSKTMFSPSKFGFQ